MSAPNVFEDLSGISTSSFSNPYQALIAACEDDPAQIQTKYALHRATRNSQQKAKMLDEDFPGVNIDPILLRLSDATVEPGYADPRHCLVLWGRPTTKIKDLIQRVQQELLVVAPNLWLMPRDCQHITALEVTHSKKAEEIQKLVDQMRDKVPRITDYTFEHRVRLIKPTIGYDASALALSFVPAAGEGLHSGRSLEDDKFTYHHLRRDLYDLCEDTGVTVDSRYVVPSSHLTIGRFITAKDLADDQGAPDPAKMSTFIKKIEEINSWLEKEFWPEHNNGTIPDGGEFNLGMETGLTCRMGTLWYGGGEPIHFPGSSYYYLDQGSPSTSFPEHQSHYSETSTMFNRDRLPGLPGSSPRPPPRNDGYGQPPPQQPRQPPQPGYDSRMGGYDDRQQQGYGAPQQGYGAPQQRMPARGPPGGGGSARQLRPIKSPGGNAYAFGNLVAVSPQDFPPTPDGSDIYILLNGNYVLSARPTQGCQPGEIGLTDAQRTWAGITLGPQDMVAVQNYDAFSQGGQSYLGGVEVEVGFAARKTTDVPYDQDELATQFKKNFKDQIIAPGQQLLLDVKNIPLRMSIRTVQLVDLSMEKSDASAPPSTDPRARGILTSHSQIDFFKDARTDIKLKASNRRPAANSIIQPGFKFEDMGIGGLDTEFSAIFRRAFASRIFPPGLVEKLGIQHVRGILLYGPPGTGKTLIARQIGKMLNAREPKVINGPEVLNKYVGQSEENIRKLFADAEKEYKEKGDESGLHIIIFDELDAVCKQRGSTGGGTGVGDSVVNQLLSKLDGVDQLNNILLIGMTNRMDMIDEALLRAGRLEVHMEISLPDESGRAQILKIHTTKMRKNDVLEADVNVEELAKLTKNFSGAELNGLVKAASSFAFSRHIKVGTMAAINPDVENMKVNRQDFLAALEEVKPLFGAAEEELGKRMSGGIIHYSPFIKDILDEGRLFINQVRKPDSTPILSVALHGPPGSGKTAMAARMAIDSGFPFIKLVSPEDMVGFSEMQKVQQLDKIFRDAYKSALSVIVIDNIEMLVDWVPIGPRFSNTVLVALKVLLAKQPPKDRRLLIFATTTERSVLTQLDLFSRFDAEIAVPNINTQNELAHVLQESGAFSDRDQQRAISEIQEITGSTDIGVGIKKILTGIETAKQDQDVPGRFARVMSRAIAANRT
ncbi:P-loop containing nucleoside triphosphate hydrolase protein [Boeremia exigua]|uniref:P-loop containing nucleoside triphosphate hydrolase protein n=1 Tax=Boeremia exigua TaxID=749465 RepID=UPI001E8DAB19|nr:P-loop containing nucleoside triphosphate hydrolase protein [Boeremia exigua]KAH6643749.1 P-loop containing nucleoside triphosphate hydrolase protein [Boeremia exigua]